MESYHIYSREDRESKHQAFVQYPRVNLMWLDSNTQFGLKDSKITMFCIFQMEQTTAKYTQIHSFFSWPKVETLHHAL